MILQTENTKLYKYSFLLCVIQLLNIMVVKIKTTSALGLALAHTGEGEAQNVVVQVMNTNVEQKS